MNYVYCAYRAYSINVFKKLKKKYKNFVLIDSNDKLTLSKIKKINPKFIFFPDWSWIVSDEIIKNFHCVCIHESNLPKFRGGSPIQNQIIRGIKKTKTTAFFMNNKIDSGNILLTIDGTEINGLEQFVELVFSRPGKRVDIEIQRNGETYLTEVNLGVKDDDSTKGFIGIGTTIDKEQINKYLAVEKYSFPQNFTMAIDQTNEMIVLTLNMFGKMITGQISGKNLSGPVGIAKDAGTVAKRGLIATLSFMAIISISLGILNLLPVPVLDGGQIVFVLVEKIIRRPLPEKIQIVFQQIGVGALLFLMVFALYNDLTRIFN